MKRKIDLLPLVRGVLIFLAMIVFPVSSWGDPFTLKDLKQILESKPIQSVEELLPLLPESMRANYALMKETQSSQGASPENPRAIPFGEDAKLVLTFNGDSKQIGYHVVEVMAFDDVKKEFQLFDIEFPSAGGRSEKGGGNEGRAHLSGLNPDRCLNCHGNPPKPIWGPYRTWKGAYGEEDDLEKSGEYEHFSKKSFVEHPRYKHLLRTQLLAKKGVKDIFPLPFHDLGSHVPRMNTATMPNSRLTLNFSKLMTESIIHEFEQSQGFEKFVYQFLYYNLNCDLHTVAEERNHEKLKKLNLKSKKSIMESPGSGPDYISSFAEAMVPGIIRRSNINFNFGSPSDLSLKGLRFGDFSDGNGGVHFKSSLSMEIYNKLGVGVPLEDGRDSNALTGMAVLNAISCIQLLDRAIEKQNQGIISQGQSDTCSTPASSALEPPIGHTIQATKPVFNALNQDAALHALEKCKICHVDEGSIKPAFSFQNRKSLLNYLKMKPENLKTFEAALKKMPPKKPLSEDEQADVKEYILGISSFSEID